MFVFLESKDFLDLMHNVYVSFSIGSFIWNNCMWNHKFKNMVWTTTSRDVPFSIEVLSSCALVLHFYFVFHFSGKVYVYLCVETHAGYE